MATVITPIVGFANGLVTVKLRWNNLNGNISQIQFVNNSDFPVLGYGTLATGTSRQVTCNPNSTLNQNISGFQFQMEAGIFESPPGVVFGARWPA